MIAPRYWSTSRPPAYSIADWGNVSRREIIEVGKANRRVSPMSATKKVAT